jgi:hypothetical protein
VLQRRALLFIKKQPFGRFLATFYVEVWPKTNGPVRVAAWVEDLA